MAHNTAVTMTGRVLCVIPARGGSKGVTKKNLRRVLGESLIARTVRIARGAKRVDRVIVTTDDSEIADAARAVGSEVVDRPLSLAADESSSESAVRHALEMLMALDGYSPEITVLVQCTAALLRADDIDRAIVAISDDTADSAFTGRMSHVFMWRLRADGVAEGVNHDVHVRQRRQERPVEVLEDGAVYAFKTAGFLASGHRFFGTVRPVIVDRGIPVEIDEPRDLVIAEALVRAWQRIDPVDGEYGHIQAVAFDFDGVLTDNNVTVNEDGVESVSCSRSDGMGISRLLQAGVAVAVFSTETNNVVSRRCSKLRIPCRQGLSSKTEAILEWSRSVGVTREHLAFVGNDMNDVECASLAATVFAPADAHPVFIHHANRMLISRGGQGAVREVSDLILGTL